MSRRKPLPWAIDRQTPARPHNAPFTAIAAKRRRATDSPAAWTASGLSPTAPQSQAKARASQHEGGQWHGEPSEVDRQAVSADDRRINAPEDRDLAQQLGEGHAIGPKRAPFGKGGVVPRCPNHAEARLGWH